jgi:maltooligosyltrehalose trehalohydrolase
MAKAKQAMTLTRGAQAEVLDGVPRFGAEVLANGRCRFVAWAPNQTELSIVSTSDNPQDKPQVAAMDPSDGFYRLETTASDGTRYRFRLSDGREFPDPASRFQPDGVHGASAVVDTRIFQWTDADFAGHDLREMVIYELHVGTFTPEGTFDEATSRLLELAELGITAVELMPVAQFPGTRNWGYDGTFPFAVQNSYGGPAGLQRFVDAAHGYGLSVILDVVYNHLGPEGNYLSEFGPFFTNRYQTPWGDAVNFDGPDSRPVREFFVQNAVYWLEEFHVDGLRLDAVHSIFDSSAPHFLAELKERVAQLAARSSRKLLLIAESDMNEARLLHARSQGGYGLDAQWSDDFHHALHALLTRESAGYYGDFGSLADLGIALRDGWRYSGEHSKFRARPHGSSPKGIAPERFVIFIQNHDQVGNRAAGERLTKLVDFEYVKFAAGVVLLSPFVPLLFMGEEYGEERPFQYFTSHADAALIEAVRRGRREEFARFCWSDRVPDPQDEETFKASVLDWEARASGAHRTLRSLYRLLIEIRKKYGLGGSKAEVEWDEHQGLLTLDYPTAGVAVVFYFGQEPLRATLPKKIGSMPPILNSSDEIWRGESALPRVHGSNAAAEGTFVFGPRSFVVFEYKAGKER